MSPVGVCSTFYIVYARVDSMALLERCFNTVSYTGQGLHFCVICFLCAFVGYVL